MRGSINFPSSHVISSEGKQKTDYAIAKNFIWKFIEVTELGSNRAPLHFFYSFHVFIQVETTLIFIQSLLKNLKKYIYMNLN